MTRQWTYGVACALAGAFLFTSVAEAQKAPRYTRDKKVQVKVKQTERTKKLEPKKTKKKKRPDLTADDFIAIQGEVKHIRKEQVQLLNALIDDTESGSEKADLQFRLAELHGQLARYWRFRAMEMYGKIDKARSKSQKRDLRRKQKRYILESKKQTEKTIDVFTDIFRAGYKNYPRMDEVLFYFAYTLQQTKDPKHVKTSRTVFHRLIKDYPDSKYIPEAYLAFADYYFSQNSLANAEQFYDKVLKFPKAKVYTYALYKKGWVYLNLDQPQEALETFHKVAQMTKNDRSKKTLNQAAKKDIVRAYAEVGKPRTAFKFFQRVDRKFAFTMLNILADIYLEQGKAPKAIYTYREMINLRPKHKQVCEWQYNVVHAMISIGSNEQKAEEIEKLVKLYAFLRAKNVLPEAQMSECREVAESTTSEMAKIWHSESNKTLNPETLKYADRLYKVFIETFKDSDEWGEIQYYMAELLWARAENEKNKRLATELWERAAVAFTDVVKTGKVDAKLKKESAYAAVLGWKNALAVDPRTDTPPPEAEYDKIPEPEPIPERQKKMISAFDIYIDYIKDPKDEELAMMKFLKARIYWRYNHLDEAVPLFENIVDSHMEHETAEYSVRLLLDTYNRQKKYAEMLKLVDKLLKKKKWLAEREDLAEHLDLLKRQSMRKAAEQIEAEAKKTGDFAKYVECGKAYIEIFNRNPTGDKADEVLYNAGVCFQDGKSIGAAITMFELLKKRFPKSNHTKKAIGRLGINYGKIAWYREAAEKLEEYARRFGGEDDAYEALSDAVFYRKGIGDDKKAIDDTEYFIKQYKRKKLKEAANALYSMTSIYEKGNDQDKVVKHLRRYIREFGSRGGIDREVVARAKIGMILWEQSCPVRGVNGACIKVRRERASLRKRKRRRGRGVQLPTQCGPESKIKVQVVARDKRKVREAQQEFRRVIRMIERQNAANKVPDKDPVRTAVMLKYYSSAKFHLAEEQYEDYLRIKFPAKLDFDPKKPKVAERSKKRLLKWKAEKEKQGVKASGMYREVINLEAGGANAAWAIAAAAREGQIMQNFSDALFTATIPNDVRTGKYAEDKVDAYCDELTTMAEPLEAKSISAFSFCLDTSTKLNWFNQWSKLCEKELGQIRPQDFPTAIELRGESTNIAAITDVELPILSLEE